MIESLETQALKAAARKGQPMDVLQVLPAWLAAQGSIVPKAPFTVFHQGIHARARVYRGRWIVECPFCGGAQPAAVASGVSYCIDDACGNGGPRGAYGQWLPLTLDTLDMMSLEALLSMRPMLQTRNTSHDDTVASILAENQAHGIGPEDLPRSVAALLPRWTALGWGHESRFVAEWASALSGQPEA